MAVLLTKLQKACVKESIRFGDPVPGHLPRIVPPGGLVVDNQLIPEGVRLQLLLSPKNVEG